MGGGRREVQVFREADQRRHKGETGREGRRLEKARGKHNRYIRQGFRRLPEVNPQEEGGEGNGDNTKPVEVRQGDIEGRQAVHQGHNLRQGRADSREEALPGRGKDKGRGEVRRLLRPNHQPGRRRPHKGNPHQQEEVGDRGLLPNNEELPEGKAGVPFQGGKHQDPLPC